MSEESYFCIEDVDTAKSHFTRNGNLQIDLFGYLVTEIQGETWRIKPGINISSDWERVAILSDGRVQYLLDGTWMSAGQIQLAKFAGTAPFADPFGVNQATDDSSVPMLCNAGTHGTGMVQQGWIERPRVTKFQVTAHLLMAFLASLVINAFVSRSAVVSI